MRAYNRLGAQPYPRVLVLTPQYAPDYGPSAPIYTALCEDLCRLGCDVSVITGLPHYGGATAQAPHGLRFEERRNGVQVIRYRLWSSNTKGALGRLRYHLSVNVLFALSAFRIARPNVILADAPCLWNGLPLLVGALLRGIPFVYVVHDIYPDVLAALGAVRNPIPLRLIGSVESTYYRMAHTVSVLSDGFKANLVGKGVPLRKIVVIPACVDVSAIQPLPKENRLRDKWGLGGKFVVLYAGNLGLSQGLEIILEAADRLRAYEDIGFVFVGEGADKESLQELALKRGLANVHFRPFQVREDVPLVYAVADVSVVSLRAGIVAESVPSKTYSIMASGRAIVAAVADQTEVARLIDRAACGIRLDPGDGAALAGAVLSLYENRSLVREMGAAGRDFVVKHFSREVAASQYHEIIQQIAGFPAT